MQEAAPGAKSMKFQNGLNPFTPFLSRPGEEMGEEEKALVENLDQRLQLMSGSAKPTNNFQPSFASSQAQMQVPQAQMQAQKQQQLPQLNVSKKKKKEDEEDEDGSVNNNNNSDDDSDFDSDFDDDFDDDAALATFRARRLAELKSTHQRECEQKGKGHGELCTISEDEFLPECTSSHWVVAHFFHRDFERCKIMDHHLKIIAKLHLSCKFVRIDAEKAPFFVQKLKIQTLPTLLVFRDGKTVHQLLGFEGLSDFSGITNTSSRSNPDEFSTASLGRFLESTGCIDYDGPDDDDDE